MDPFWQSACRHDVAFETWLVARHAHTLVRRPRRLFDTEHCEHDEKTLTLGVPMIAMGVLAVPGSLFGDPILAYNTALVALLLLAAVAMYALVAEWTGVPLAGIGAALLYAFHRLRLDVIYHPAEFDTAWTVLALFFARRLFAWGRWRDAIGLALAGALQIAASFYPTLVSLGLALPFAAWLALAYGFRRVRPAQLAFVAGSVALAAAALLGPYAEARAASSESLRAAFHTYAAWRWYLPGGLYFPGFTLVALAALGCALPRRRVFPLLGGDPRIALAAGAILVAIVAAGPLRDSIFFELGGPWTNPYEMLAAIVPGLDSVRGVFRLMAGVHLVLALLAGFGIAGFARLAGRRATAAGAALAGVAALAVFGPTGAGGERKSEWVLEDIRPNPMDVALFAELEELGNRGPVFELPVGERWILKQPYWILVGAWHHRRTSACFGSFLPPDRERLARIAEALPQPHAIRELADLGFTTVLLHDPYRGGIEWKNRLIARTDQEDAWLRPLTGTDRAKVFAIEAPPGG